MLICPATRYIPLAYPSLPLAAQLKRQWESQLEDASEAKRAETRRADSLAKALAGAETAVLPADAPIALARVAKELQSAPTLKLHIAGHIANDEDPKLSSQRAQAVGATLQSRVHPEGCVSL